MSVQNPERLATKQDLKDMYDRIRPYMGGLVTSKAGFTPVGTVISVMGTTAPVNYLACDGTVYNIADYTELANYFNEQFGSKNFFGGDGTTTFAVPDLRGEFLRGTGTNSHTNQGSGASVGVHQDATENISLTNWDTNKLLIELKYPALSNTSNNSIKNKDYSIADTSLSDKKGRSYIEIAGQYISSASMGSEARYTSRPTNTSVLYCIATKNFYIDPTLDYSTDEKIVGTWLSGEPIYQKTITNFIMPSATNIKTSNFLGVSVDRIVKLYGSVIDENNYSFSFFSSFGNNVKFLYNVVTDELLIQYNDASWAYGKYADITIQYTKLNS